MYLEPFSSVAFTEEHIKGIRDKERWEGGFFRGGGGGGGGGSEERKGCWREYGSKEQKARDERETNGEYKGNEIGIEDREEYKGKRWQRGGD